MLLTRFCYYICRLKKIIHIVGNRPQFIKLAVLYKAIAESGMARQFILHTGQHSSHEMSGIFFDQLALPAPDIRLQIDNTDPDLFIAAATRQIRDHLFANNYNAVLIYGDTNTTYAAAIAAARSGQTLHHIEAGVRNGDLRVPEELNRVIADRLSSYHYCCTQYNLDTLKSEGSGKAGSFFTGDLMLDAYLRLPEDAAFRPEFSSYIACTIHRAEHILIKEQLEAVIAALNNIHKQIPVVMPLHPHTQKKLSGLSVKAAFRIIAPLGYSRMKAFLQHAAFIITDSGGVSREAYFARKKALVIMERPVWPEILTTGAGLACPPDTRMIEDAFQQLQQLEPDFEKAVFGKGNAASAISRHILNAL
nr:UDP-N-acetylglucosamine 2-epimerase [Niabella beijingensis]